ncbi:MAG: OB-fold domain-containing protein, partial [Methanomicrobiales archaeon]|nr:OB-fold domain-containing protein [Methanomicrobiales archaeon]
WVDLGTEGSIYAFTVVKLPYIDPNTGKPIKVPRTDIYVKLDGADTCLMRVFHPDMRHNPGLLYSSLPGPA